LIPTDGAPDATAARAYSICTSLPDGLATKPKKTLSGITDSTKIQLWQGILSCHKMLQCKLLICYDTRAPIKVKCGVKEQTYGPLNKWTLQYSGLSRKVLLNQSMQLCNTLIL